MNYDTASLLLASHLTHRAEEYVIKFDLFSLGFSVAKGNTRHWMGLAGNTPIFDQANDVLDLPLKFQNQTWGTLHAESQNLSAFSKSVASEFEDLASQVACLLHQSSPRRAAQLDAIVEAIHENRPEKYHWTGIYLINAEGFLEVVCFRGERTPHMVIPVNSGICGAAVREEKTLNIADVAKDSRYLSCSIKTKSEIVVPIFVGRKVVGEIDIDSHQPNAFDEKDESELKESAAEIAKILT